MKLSQRFVATAALLICLVCIGPSQRTVFVSKDRVWIKSMIQAIKPGVPPESDTRRIVKQHNGTAYVFDRRMVDSGDGAAFGARLRTLLDASKDGPVELADLDAGTANWVKQQLGDSSFRSPHLDQALQNQKFKVGAVLSTRLRLEVNGKESEIPLMVLPDGFEEKVITDGYVTSRGRVEEPLPTGDELESVLSQTTKILVFPMAPSWVTQGLEIESLRILKEERDRFLATRNAEIEKSIAEILLSMQGESKNAWNGKDPVSVKDLDAGFQADLAKAVRSQYANLGFTSPDNAEAYFKRAKISGAKTGIMLRWGSRRSDGTPFHQGFRIGG